jgi:methionyl-tRNA synthetase
MARPGEGVTVARFYITTAIDYVNSQPHLGQAYEKICADVIARHRRLIGDDVRFVMGNDEHSQNVFKRARQEGLEPLAYCDRMEGVFRTVWAKLDISFDDFIRTTEARHRAAVQEMVRRSHARGDIFEGEYEGWYCVSCEEFKPEKVLVDGACPIHKTKPEWIKERNYFFRLSAYADRLLAHYREHPEFIEPVSRRNEVESLVRGGLEDISVSRAGQAWGVPLPFDSKSVVYVWYDALINYVSATGFPAASYTDWWPADLHVIGKDITRFHCVVWPAMLMSAGLALPKQVFGHGWVTFKGEKMSKSLGTGVDPLEATERVGADPLRWYLSREIIWGQDGDFSWELFEKSYNADLANNLGNLVNRVTSMAHRYRGGTLRSPGRPPELSEEARRIADGYHAAMTALNLAGGASAAMALVDGANELIARREPWKLAKAGDDRALDAVLWDASEILRAAAVRLSPFMPASCGEILRRLGRDSNVSPLGWRADGELRPDGDRNVVQGNLLWPRLEAPSRSAPTVSTKETRVTDQPIPVPAPAPGPGPAAPAAPAAAPADARISIDDFLKIDLRVARVTAAERVPNSKKLIKLSIDVGTEQRTVVAGIAEAYEAEKLVGRYVAIVANLKPAKLMGIESNGMVLAASAEGGLPILVGFETPPAPGTRVR